MQEYQKIICLALRLIYSKHLQLILLKNETI